MDRRYDDIIRTLKDIVVPLVEADGGEIFLVSGNASRFTLHLAGHLAGAPGKSLICRRILEPVIHIIAPDAEVVLSAGWRIPEGAVRLESGTKD